MAADQQLVAGVRNALELQFYNDLGYEGVSAVILTTDGASAESDDSFAAAAMAAAYGDGWKSNKLNYSGWGNGASISQEAIDYFLNGSYDTALAAIYNGTSTPSFANDVDDLFLLIKDTATGIGGKLEQSGADLVQGAAEHTITNNSSLAASDFATFWANSTWSNTILGSNDNDYDENAGDLDNTNGALNAAVANAAAIKARNTALAGYLEQQGYGEVYSVFADYVYGTSVVPKDAAGELLSGNGAVLGQKISAAYLAENPDGDVDEYLSDVSMAICSYYGMDEDGVSPEDVTSTQAYVDGLAYYALMDSVYNVNNDKDSSTSTSDDTYWDEMSAAVSLYGSIASGKTNLTDLNAIYSTIGEVDSAVVVTAMISDGKITTNVSPSYALVG